MAKLTYKQKKSFPASVYGLPSEKKYPIPDKAHARSAKSYASREEHAGKLSPAQKAQIDRIADAKLMKHESHHDHHIGGEGKSHLRSAMEHLHEQHNEHHHESHKEHVKAGHAEGHMEHRHEHVHAHHHEHHHKGMK